MIRRAALLLLLALCLGTAGAGWWMMAMPKPERQPLGDAPASLAAGLLEARLQRDVEALAGGIGERHDARPKALEEAASWVERRLAETSSRAVARLPFQAQDQTFYNLEVSFPGRSKTDELLVVGAHYDSARNSPAADDNASGVAGLLALAAALSERPPERTVRLVAFANEEPPHFKKDSMGSLAYARAAEARGDRIAAMLSLETIGYFRDEPGTQKYPPPLSLFYPNRGDFIALVGNLGSRALVQRTVASFRASSGLPAEGAALPGGMPGVSWSDHWSFWQSGYPAVMVTDTAPFRNPNYHTPKDTPDTLDYPRMAEVIRGVYWVLVELARG